MKYCRKSPLILLKLILITLLPVFKAQETRVQPEVTGYLGHDVSLPCRFIPGPKDANITQVQWVLKPPEREKLIIIVSNKRFGVSVQDTFLKGRVEMAEQSLIIRGLEMRDAGSYTCSISTFPSGSFEGTTNLVVQKQMSLSSGVVSAIVIAVMLLLVIVATIAYYLIFIRRPASSVSHRVYIDTGGPVMDAARPSVTAREEDVVYSDVKLKPSRVGTPSSNDKRTVTAHVEDVTYADVVVLLR